MFPRSRNAVRPARSSPHRRRVRPAVEALEDRTVPAVFAPLASATDGSISDPGLPTSLRETILAANGNGQDDVINLEAGTYRLTVRNLGGQENAAATGDLDL